MFISVQRAISTFKDFSEIVRDRAIYLACAALLLGASTVPMLPARTATAAPLELINPSLEQVTAGVPNCFYRAGWGTNTPAWGIVAGRTGANAQSLTISGYTSGDRKLMPRQSTACAPAVTPGKTYDLSVWYKSTSAKNNLTVFRHSAAGWTYWTDLRTVPASAAWAEAAATTPVVPEGTDQITFGMSLSANGTLITDDYGFKETAAPTPTPTPTPTPQPAGELTTNGGLETGGALPDGWKLAGWGDAAVTGGPTADAHGGQRAYSLTLAGRTAGDYKLLPTEAAAPAVQPGNTYNLSVWYKSTVAQNSLTVFAHTASGWGYWTDIQTLPAAAAWTKVEAVTPAIPAGIDAIAWGVSLYGNGTLVTDDYSTTKVGEVAAPNQGAAADGEWSVLDYPMPLRGLHATVLKNGRVLLIAGSGNSVAAFNAGSFQASVWDPISGTFTALAVPKDMFCAGHVTLADGRVLVQGGTGAYGSTGAATDYTGLKDSWLFDPDTNLFTATNDANEGHWYPTLTQLGNGDVWMAGGLKTDGTGAVNTEKFDATTNQWLPTGQVQQTWSFWGLYPHMFLMSDGRLFYSGGHVFGNGLPGTGASIYNHETGAIADIAGLRQKDMRDQAASVLLPPAQDQKVLITGGGNINTFNPAISLTDIIDLKETVPSYKPGPDLPGPGKMYLNATILPDRTVLFSNGGRLNRDDASNVLTAAIYDPATNTMRSVAADPIGRNYHSAAVLLPDGRVAVVGSNPGDGSFEMRISMYRPGYLFRTVRPEITNAPATVTYGQNINFNVNAPGKLIRSAQLTRPMSVTHQMDSNMRLVDLPVTVANGIATATVPSNPNLMPPGPYMLTVTDSDGVPSVAAWVTVR